MESSTECKRICFFQEGNDDVFERRPEVAPASGHWSAGPASSGWASAKDFAEGGRVHRCASWRDNQRRRARRRRRLVSLSFLSRVQEIERRVARRLSCPTARRTYHGVVDRYQPFPCGKSVDRRFFGPEPMLAELSQIRRN